MKIEIVLIIAVILTIIIIAFLCRKEDYVMTGGSILDSKRFPRVSVLTNRIVQTVPEESFVWLEKTDGVHTIVIIEGNKCESLIGTTRKFLFDIEGKKFVKRSIIDCEYYNETYYVFDAAEIKGEDISNKYFIDRMKAAKKLLSGRDEFIIKDYYKVKPWKQLLDFINHERSPITGNIIDGVVCQRIDRPYFTTLNDPTTFKLKRKVMNTIDFKLKYIPCEKCFYLYLFGSHNDYIYNRRKIVKKYTDVNTKGKLPNNFYILFATPYYEGLHKFRPRRNWSRVGYFSGPINEITTLMNKIIRNPSEYNEKIIEMSLAEDGWVPMRVRDDKEISNTYICGTSNLDVIFSPVTFEKSYFNKTFAFSQDIINEYHELSRMIREYSLKTLIKDPIRNVLDLAGGRGGDLNTLVELGARNIFAVDADKDALVQYANRRTSKPISINVIYSILSQNNDECINEIKNRYEYPKDGFDVILMNFAFHYLCYDHRCIEALNTLIRSVLKPGGLFIMSYFSGDEIISEMEDGKVTKGPFTIELCKPEMKSDKDSIWAKMALPTIDSSGYRPEPLVTQKWIDKLQMKSFRKINPLNEMNLKNIYSVSKYLKLICSVAAKHEI